MAGKKSYSEESSAPKTTGAGKSPPKRIPPTKISKPALPPGSPLIDTSLAAEAAASILKRHSIPQQPAQAVGVGESAAFKQLKQSVNKPKLSNQILGKLAPISQKKSAANFSVSDQVGHDQAFGDPSRRGVPRRTPG
jgi:hypothetical protein